MPTTEKLRNKLMDKLTELFQLDQPDLDFGFYRIMHAKAKQVTSFIDKDLLQIIEDAFGQVDEGRKAELQANIQKEIEAAKEYGVADPENSPKVIQAKAKYDVLKDGATAESDVYDHLYRFFERYYDEGDFISRRYYTRENAGKAAPFAIPYNGEEVKLHWANADQYYIKTAEYFSSFSFDIAKSKEVEKLKNDGKLNFDGDKPESLKVHFRIVDASEGEHGNVKAAEDKKRFFILHEENPIEFNDADELVINFEYKALPGGKNNVDVDTEKALKEKFGKSLNKGDMPNLAIAEKVIEAASGVEKAQKYLSALSLYAPTNKISNRPLLVKYINQYTARNTCDYFIHKDLSGFLKRELDFYIKNEVMHLDDIENADVPAVENYLAKLKVIRKIATKLIDFLAQLEDFQKKLWLKKKFVTETNYCITLDRVPEELYGEIAANDAQREEWVKLFAIDEIKGDAGGLPGMGSPAYSVPLTTDFLKANDKLVLDTAFFSSDFKAKLIASIEEFDEQCDGLLIHSENFQALNLLQERYREQVKFIYIDPPYNTGGDGFFYKDAYQHSSWITMIIDRLKKSYHLLKNDGVLYSSIDAVERSQLESALSIVFERKNRVEEVIWAQNTTKNQSPTFSTNHEYVEVYSKNIEAVKKNFSMFRESKPGYSEIMELIEEANQKYLPLAEAEKILRDYHKEHKRKIKEQGLSPKEDEWMSLYNYNRVEYRGHNGEFVPEEVAAKYKAKLWVWREVDTSMPQVKQDSQKEEFRDPSSPTYRFYQPNHPVTGKPCRSPKTGWRWPYKQHGNQQNNFCKLNDDHRIVWGSDESKIPQQKSFLHEVETNVAKSVVNDYADGEKELTNLFGKSRSFSNPKPSSLIKRFCSQAATEKNIVLDFFAGSGTTIHSTIELNRTDEGNRKYLLIEMGDYFDTVTKPRISKVIYSSDWKSGKPTSRDTGISQCFKYIRLESYEDTLNNLVFDENPVRGKAIKSNPSLKEDYMLRYLLNVETRGSQSLLNIDAFADPTAYALVVKKPGSDEQVTQHIDLIETFNYLLGLRLENMAVPQTFTANFTRKPDPELPKDQYTKLVVNGKIQKADNGKWWFRKLEGWVPANPMNPNNGQKERVLIVWRKLTGNLEEDNLMLDEWFEKYRISTRDFEYDTIYVNGSNNLPNLKKDDENWKVRLIEEEFHKKMWEVGGEA